MKTKIYNSYSTLFKLRVINGEVFNVNYNTSYYWKTTGKKRINQALEIERSGNNCFNLNKITDELLKDIFGFFRQFVEYKKSIKQLYRKQKASIVLLIERLKPFADIFTICNWFNISERTYYNWRNKPLCRFTYSKECPNIVTTQLSDRERKLLENEYFFNEKYANRNVSELYAQTLADKKVIVSESVFYDMARFLNEGAKRKSCKKPRYEPGIRAKYAKEVIHMDRTKIRVANVPGQKAWVSLVCDNRSRAILGFNVSLSSCSMFSLSNLKGVVKRFNLTDRKFMLITDDGSENWGETRAYTLSEPNIDHRVAQLSIEGSNSMIESVIRQLKYLYLKKWVYGSLKELIADLNVAINEYNNRPKKIHLGKTPWQVLFGDEQDVEEFKALKKMHLRRRIDENREFKCLKADYTGFYGR